jgi:hypothetical protein
MKIVILGSVNYKNSKHTRSYINSLSRDYDKKLIVFDVGGNAIMEFISIWF